MPWTPELRASIADVTLTITGRLADTGQGEGRVKYGGPWLMPELDSTGMQFHIIPVPSVYGTYIATGDPVLTTPGLYYFSPEWQAFPAGTDVPAWSYALGLGTLVKPFVDGEIIASLRFVTDRDADGYGVARCYCDSVLVDEHSPAANPTLPDLVSNLWLVNEAAQGMRVRTVTAKVWECDAVTGKVLTAENAATHKLEPTLKLDATHKWAEWVKYMQAGQHDTRYMRTRDLHTDGSATYMDYATDEDGALYGDTNGFGEIVFDSVSGILAPSLSLAHHAVAGCLLATDTGFVKDVGFWKIQRLGGVDNQWSKRVKLAPADIPIKQPPPAPPLKVTWHQTNANLLCDSKGVSVLVESTAQYDFGSQYTFYNHERLFRAGSLDGSFDEGGVVLADGVEQAHGAVRGRVVRNQQQPFGTISNGRYITASVGTQAYDYLPGEGGGYVLTPVSGYKGDLRFNIMSMDRPDVQDKPFPTVHKEVVIYDGLVARQPALARHPLTWRLFAAAATYTSGAGVLMYTSSDQGLSWKHANRIVGGVSFPTMKTDYPYLYCDNEYLWMVVYREVAGQEDGAQGEVVLYQFRPTPVTPEQPLYADEVAFELVDTSNVVTNGSYSFNQGIVVGPCDEGRCAIIRDPLTKALTVIAPRTTTWTQASLPVGIVEYRSTNSGATWKKIKDHPVTA